MDYSVAEMNCVLSVNIQCEACKAKVYEILQNIYGVYTIAMDAEEGTVKICGKVNPNTVLRLLQNSEKHAEVKSVRFDGEVREKRYYHYGEDFTSCEPPCPHPFFDYPEHHWFDRTYHQIPPHPPSYPWQMMQPPPPSQLALRPPPPSATWPHWPVPRPPSIIPPAMPRPPRPQSAPPPPPEDEKTEVINSNQDGNKKCCRIM